jgi:hypothetical protein
MMKPTAKALALVLPLLAVQAPLGPSASAAPAASPAATEEAQRHYKRGMELYDDNDMHGALAEFERAYKLVPNHKMLYNIGQVRFQLQDYAGALSAFERYLTEGGSSVDARRREEVRKEIERLQGRVARVEVSANLSGAEISVDDVPVATTPLYAPIVVSAGRRRITATAKGRLPVSKTVEVVGGDHVRVSLELGEAAAAASSSLPASPVPGASASSPPAVPATAPAETPQRPIPWAGWAITGVLAVGATVTGVMALGASQDLKDKRGQPNVGSSALEDASGKSKTLALTTDILAGAAIVAGGISLYLTLQRGSEAGASQPAGSVQLGIAPNGLRLLGSF